jgi:sulfate permease, SulP family
MAYATIADLPVEVGLYTCMVPMAAYALLGASRTLSVSTTSTVAVLTGSTLVAAGVAASSQDPARSLAALTLLVGVILLIARLLRLGGLIDNISEATLTGIKVGVGLTVAAGQLPNLLGVKGDPTADNFFSELRGVIDTIGDISWATAVFSAITIGVLVGLRRFAPQVPGPLVAVIGGILLVAVASIDDHGVALIDPVPSGLPTPVAPSFDHFDQLLPGAFAIAIMVFLETLAVGRSVRRKEEPPIDNDQELFASGLRAWPARSSAPCRPPEASPRPRSTSAPALAHSSASSSPWPSPSAAPCSSAACSAICPRPRWAAWSSSPCSA